VIIWAERQQESYDRIKRIFKYTAWGGGLQRVDIPMQDTDGNIMTDGEGKPILEVLLKADDIYNALMERNKQHFHQAFDTPFGSGVNDGILADLVGYSGLTTAAKDIVDGTFMDKHGDKVDLLPEREQLIIEMAMPKAIKTLGNINSIVTIHNFVSAFKKWKESTFTSPSPSRRHLDHYKAIVNDPEKKYWDVNLTELFVKVTNIPLQYGFAPDRWCKSITVMIEKDPGNS
jgi:hypothetical protein